jgi:hypothetical protein
MVKKALRVHGQTNRAFGRNCRITATVPNPIQIYLLATRKHQQNDGAEVAHEATFGVRVRRAGVKFAAGGECERRRIHMAL